MQNYAGNAWYDDALNYYRGGGSASAWDYLMNNANPSARRNVVAFGQYDSNGKLKTTQVANGDILPMIEAAQQQIAAQQAPVNQGAASGPAPKVLNQSAINATQKAIDSLGTEREVGYKNIDDSYNSLIGKYDREKTRNEGEYTDQSNTNSTNLQKNKQNALLAAAQGRRGLRGTLSAIGALTGDGGALADRAVTTSANQDIGQAADTFATNAQGLDKAIDRFREEDEDRRREAGTTRKNQRTKLEGEIEAKRQDYFQKMAEIYGAADRTGEANSWLDKAGGLNNTIAKKTRVASTSFSPRSAAFTPGDLEGYLAGAGDMTVDVAQGGGGGQMGAGQSILAGRGRRRDEEEAIA